MLNLKFWEPQVLNGEIPCLCWLNLKIWVVKSQVKHENLKLTKIKAMDFLTVPVSARVASVLQAASIPSPRCGWPGSGWFTTRHQEKSIYRKFNQQKRGIYPTKKGQLTYITYILASCNLTQPHGFCTSPGGNPPEWKSTNTYIGILSWDIQKWNTYFIRFNGTQKALANNHQQDGPTMALGLEFAHRDGTHEDLLRQMFTGYQRCKGTWEITHWHIDIFWTHNNSQ